MVQINSFGRPRLFRITVRFCISKPVRYIIPLVLLMAGCGKKPVDTPPDPLLLRGDVEIVNNIEMLYSDSMHLRARIEGKKLVKYLSKDNERDEFPEGVKVTFYEKDGSESSTLIADVGVRLPRKNQIKANGNVVFENTEGEMLETEELIWDEENDRVFTKKFVTFTTPEEKVWGMGFEANQTFTRRRIYAPEGKVQLKE